MEWKNTKRMKCPNCGSIRLRLAGNVKGKQRYECKKCGKYTVKPRFLFKDVSGTVMKGARNSDFLRPGPSGGLKRLPETKRRMRKTASNSMSSVGTA